MNPPALILRRLIPRSMQSPTQALARFIRSQLTRCNITCRILEILEDARILHPCHKKGAFTHLRLHHIPLGGGLSYRRNFSAAYVITCCCHGFDKFVIRKS